MITNSSDIEFIHGDVHDKSSKNEAYNEFDKSFLFFIKLTRNSSNQSIYQISDSTSP